MEIEKSTNILFNNCTSKCSWRYIINYVINRIGRYIYLALVLSARIAVCTNAKDKWGKH